MDLKQFAETYIELEDKALEIMKVYDIEHYSLEGIEIENYNNKTIFLIKTEIYYSGCGSEYETLSFDIEEMNNGIDYFKEKHEKEIKEEEKIEKLKLKKESEERRIQKDNKDKADYERLKKKYENKS